MTMGKCKGVWLGVVALGAVTAATVSGGQAPQTKTTEQRLTTTDGTKIVATLAGKEFKVFTEAGVKRTPLKDGEYTLPNGGAIRVKGGTITWDAFGAVERVKRTGVGKGQVVGVPG